VEAGPLNVKKAQELTPYKGGERPVRRGGEMRESGIEDSATEKINMVIGDPK